MVIRPGRKLVAYSIDISENRVGILRDISDAIAERGGDIIYLHTQVDEEGRRGIIFIVIDTTSQDRKFDPEELRRSLSRVAGVGSVDLILPIREGLLIDTIGFPIYVGRSRAILMRDALFRGVRRELIRRIGPEATDALLYNIGFEMGLEAGEDQKRVADSVGVTDSEDVIRLISIPLFKALGYGEVEVEFSEHGGAVRLYRDIECESTRDIDGGRCSLIRGMLAGALTSILGREAHLREVECESSSGICKFRIEFIEQR